ncbi:MAG: DUF2007 domain-containing protein [Gammaproteobacteria bacterium]|nr:DUF2007 domain-containing protein [Gammaproteobacteria bacterium]
MKRVHSSESLPEIGHLKNLLEQAGIACVVRNEQLSGGLGEIPFLECLPELWVLDDADLPRARRLIEQQQESITAPAWRCAACGSPSEGQFAVCWNCGAADERPDARA